MTADPDGFDRFARTLLGMLGVEGTVGSSPATGLFDDLGLDSLQTLRLLLAVETMAGLDHPPEDLPEMYTLGDAHRYYLSLAASAVGDD